MITTFHQSLICLAVIEIVFLLLVILDHSLGFSSPLYIALFPHLINPLKNIMMSCETFLIMSIALERLLAVCRPIHYRQTCRRCLTMHSGATPLLSMETYFFYLLQFSSFRNGSYIKME